MAQGAKGRGEDHRPEMTQQEEAIENELFKVDPLSHHIIIIQGKCRHINDGSRTIRRSGK